MKPLSIIHKSLYLPQCVKLSQFNISTTNETNNDGKNPKPYQEDSIQIYLKLQQNVSTSITTKTINNENTQALMKKNP